MTDLAAVIHELTSLFDSMDLPYAIMGGIAVRAHGIPRPTFDVDFTLAVPRDRLATLFAAIEGLGYTIPEQRSSGWIDAVKSRQISAHGRAGLRGVRRSGI